MSALYLLVNFGVVVIPLAFSWHPAIRFVDEWPAFWKGCLVVLVGFVAWDVVFAARGVWGFADQFVAGPRIGGLPLEEWMFFVCIPYACVFTYHALKCFGRPQITTATARILSAAVLALCILLAVGFRDHMYTSVVAVLTALYTAYLLLASPRWMGTFWTSYLVLTVPFVLTNGILTGLRFWKYPIINTRPDEILSQIVWYDNVHTVGTRLFSIPLEDFLYAFLLIGLNVAIFELIKSRSQRAEVQESQ